MKKIIDGKLYDTDKATRIGYCGNNLPSNDFTHWYEALYKSYKGQYFIVGSGGPKSHFAVTEGTRTYGTSNIWLVNKKDIAEWLEKNCSKFLLEEENIIIQEIGFEEG